MNSLSDFILGEIDCGSFPSAQYAIAERNSILTEAAHGFAVVAPERIPATLETIYDLASLTKPLVTALLCVRLNDQNLFKLSDCVSHFFDDFKVDGKRDIALADLLTHTSGLPRWRPLYCDAVSPDQTITAIARLPVEHDSIGPGRPVIYSDLNYIVAGRIIEIVTGETLDRVAHRELFAPLQLTSTMFNPRSALRRQIAATELGRAYERKAIHELGLATESSAVSSVNEIIWGTVHDGNACFLGGVAGHAGLFSTAREVVRLASQFLPGSALLRNESLRLFTTEVTGTGRDTSRDSWEARSIGWLLASTPDCSAGPGLPACAIGHNGFTGTSVWIDPLRQRTYVLLTNRVHPAVSGADMKAIRRRFHALAAEVTD